ncbi:MAG TPA: hypothetical protein VFD41_09855 [Actinomycetales bacterium]|nr:hypothetical protein [Actinomycetales bacterium]
MHNAAVPVSMTIRNVPDGVRDELAARARRAGQSLQEYMRAEVIELAGKMTMEEWLDRVRKRRERSGTGISAEEILEHLHADRT